MPSHEQTSSIKKQLIPGIISLVVGLIILITKFYAYKISSSQALKSDAIESIVNVLAAAMTLFALWLSHQEADREHPYGHGKIEYFSSAFEGSCILLAAVWIGSDAFEALFKTSSVQSLGLGLVINLSAGAVNGLLGLYLLHMGKKKNSMALKADAHHVLSDFLTSLGLGVALAGVYFTQILWLDPLIAIFVSIIMAVSSFKILRDSFRALMDTEDKDLVVDLTKTLEKLRGDELIAAHGLRTLRSGPLAHIDLHAVVPEFWEVSKAHDAVSDLCLKVLADLKIQGEFHTHLDPCQKEYCSQCALENCPIRQGDFVKKRSLSVKMITTPEVNS